MKLFLIFAFVLYTLLAIELFANETEDKLEKEKPMEREIPDKIYRDMKKRGLLDIDEEEGLVPLIIHTDGNAIPNQYIARLRPGGDYEKISRILEGRGFHERLDFSEELIYVILRDIDDSDLQQLRQLQDVFEDIEQDKTLSLATYHRAGPFAASLSWNLDRIDYFKDDDLFFTWAKGTGIDAYVMDSGINPDHQDFGGRVREGWHGNFTNSRDFDGHGTLVASILGGATFGVAKEVTLIPVKVCATVNNCSESHILKGLNWIEIRVKNSKTLSVINMSLASKRGTLPKIDEVVEAVLDAGIPVVAAAGNIKFTNYHNSCDISPANVPRALTVGATEFGDGLASYSFRGKCVDIYAPGTAIRGANHSDNTGWRADNGTSFAAPHVAGAVAGLLQVFRDAGYHTAPSVGVLKDINKYIIEYAEKNTVEDLPAGSNDVMLQTTGKSKC